MHHGSVSPAYHATDGHTLRFRTWLCVGCTHTRSGRKGAYPYGVAVACCLEQRGYSIWVTHLHTVCRAMLQESCLLSLWCA